MSHSIFKVLLFSCSIAFVGCISSSTSQAPLLSEILNSSHPSIKKVMDSLSQHNIQVIYSVTSEDDSRDASFQDQSFQLDDQNYFYPASSVKFPIAILALEKANSMDSISSITPFRIDGDTITTTIRKEVQKIFAVSDNQAYNRLYEFLGADYINSSLESKNLTPSRISHRLSVANSSEPRTKRLTFYIPGADSLVIGSHMNKHPTPFELNAITKGKGYYKSDSLINEPFDFSLKNYLPLSILHEMIKSVFFPTSFDEKSRFNIKSDDLSYLWNCMQALPKDSGYNPAEYYDSYVKFFMFGDSKESMPNHIKIYNKVGYAYGHLTDIAYIVDEKENVSFFLSATILVNQNQIYNDDNYEYDSVGIPFLAQLGREIHQGMVNYKRSIKK